MSEAKAIRHAVLLHHGLGDVAMALPMLSAVDQSVPESDEIHVIVKSDVEGQLIRLYEWRHQLKITSLAWQGSWGWWQPFRVALRLRLLRPASFIAPHAADSIAAAVFSRLLGAKYSVGPAGRFGKLGYSVQVEATPTWRHKVDRYSEYATSAGFTIGDTECQLNLSGKALAAAMNLFSDSSETRRIVLAPMSSNVETHKRWPLESFARLGEALLGASPSTRIVVLGAPSERPELETLVAQLDASRTELVTQPSIEMTMANLQAADCVVSACTGPLHLATLVDVPIVALFGPTDPNVTGPMGTAVEVISAGLPCSPCYAPGYERGCEAPTCMTGIEVERVYDAVLAMVRRRSRSTETSV